ncbi:hypothetical protein HYX04_00420 [Candidatus Woesearchaeota archaeon]|nr:hypothetical protein [Candidatus Woesearchaeota archaeon]
MDRRAFLARTSSLGLVALLGRHSYAEVNVSRDFLSNLSTCWERFAIGTDEFKFALVSATEGNFHYFTAYGLEQETLNDIGYSYKLTRLKKNQPLAVWTRDISNLSLPAIARIDTDLDGKVDQLFVDAYENRSIFRVQIDFDKLPESSKAYNQERYERAIRALNRKMNV